LPTLSRYFNNTDTPPLGDRKSPEEMLRFLVLGVAVLALASPGYAFGPDMIKRFMDSVMGSDCGAFGCKRENEDLSRAVRDYAENVRDVHAQMEREAEEEPVFTLRELHRRLVSFADAEENLVQKVREQSRRLAEYTKRALEERDADPLNMAVRSIADIFERSETEREETNEVKRTLMDLHKGINDLKKRDSDQLEVRAPIAFARRAFNEKERMARSLSDFQEAVEQLR